MVGGKFETSGSFNISAVRMIDGSCVEVSLISYNLKRQFLIWGEVVLRLVRLSSHLRVFFKKYFNPVRCLAIVVFYW